MHKNAVREQITPEQCKKRNPSYSSHRLQFPLSMILENQYTTGLLVEGVDRRNEIRIANSCNIQIEWSNNDGKMSADDIRWL